MFEPPKGSHLARSVDDKRYFVFQDQWFVTNVFPEQMDSRVAI